VLVREQRSFLTAPIDRGEQVSHLASSRPCLRASVRRVAQCFLDELAFGRFEVVTAVECEPGLRGPYSHVRDLSRQAFKQPCEREHEHANAFSHAAAVQPLDRLTNESLMLMHPCDPRVVCST
jgi:hypothetical protein